MKGKKAIKALMGIFALGVSLSSAGVVHAANWSVHAQPGYYVTSDVVSISNHGTGYIAKCTSVSGDAASMKTNITEYENYQCTENVPLDKVVEFTSAGKSITYKANVTPSVDIVFMRAVLSYSNGKKASMAGTVVTK